ncbi:MAG TPA: cytochrome c [Gemmatimonadaceae bacterium]
MSRLVMMIAMVGCRPHADVRDARDFERMRLQQRYDAYGRSRFFANGAVLQPPPANTIARPAAYAAQAPVRSLAFFSGRSDAAFVTDIPVRVDDRLRVVGARQFAISCAPCHGVAGFGGGPIAPNLARKRPPSLRSQMIDTLSAGMIFSVITNGFGQMPPYGWQMPPATRWAVVAYVRSLATQPLTATARADSAEAAELHRLDSLHAAGVSLRELLKVTGSR